jgi:hypothetical protein
VEYSEALFVIAQLAIAIAGFTGVVTALRTRTGQLHPWDRARTVALILVTGDLLVLSLLPFGLDVLGVDGAQLWRFSCGAAIALGIPTLLVMRHFDSGAAQPYAPFFPIAGSALMLVHAVNAYVGSFGVFYLTLLASLVIGIIQFAHVLVVRPPE